MSEHKATIDWKKSTQSFDYETYNREHTWQFDNKVKIDASAAPEYKGKTTHIDPEEALVAAAAGCHMLTFLAIASKKRLVVESYHDEAVGFLEQNEDGQLAVTRIHLHPRISFSGDKKPSQEELQLLHEKAHLHCFIANSIKAHVEVK
ncbi:MAG TPA: OsmC family protein [Candidatus Omnitrophota bacterium]|nr:OsmC family protein [Candidatus Omnitrophota bacterium]